MRALFALTILVGAALAAASPATAQPYQGLALALDARREAEAQTTHSRDIAITNELSTLQARVQSAQGLRDLAAKRAAPAPPIQPRVRNAHPSKVQAGEFASIPDAELADSNAKVRAAADNHR